MNTSRYLTRFEQGGRNLLHCLYRNGAPLQQRRAFSVKELSWCAPSNSSSKRATTRKSAPREEEVPEADHALLKPIARFGIVAAMAKNRIIGVNGHLPWSIPKDRALFKRLTTGKVLILGRKSYEDEVPNGTHQLPYIRWCILVSTTADPQNYDTNKVKVARSFPEALDIAQTLAAAEEERKEIETSQGEFSRDNGYRSMDCWIGGGERIYEEALKHRSAHELHLSLVDTDIEVDDSTASTTYARFPAKYRWDSNFEEVSTVFESGSGETHNFTYYVYERKKTLT